MTDLQQRVEEIRRRHKWKHIPAIPTCACRHCGQRWPCDTVQLLDHLTALERQLEEAKSIAAHEFKMRELEPAGRREAERQVAAGEKVVDAARLWQAYYDRHSTAENRDRAYFQMREALMYYDAQREET